MLKIIKSMLGTKRFPLKIPKLSLSWRGKSLLEGHGRGRGRDLLKCLKPEWGEEISDLRNFKENRKATLKEVIGLIMIFLDVRLFTKLYPLYSIVVDYDLCAKIVIIIHQSQMNSRLITRIGLNFM